MRLSGTLVRSRANAYRFSTATAAIARRLHISPRTVGNHVQSVLEKLGVHSRLEAVTYSIKNGLI